MSSQNQGHMRRVKVLKDTHGTFCISVRCRTRLRVRVKFSSCYWCFSIYLLCLGGGAICYFKQQLSPLSPPRLPQHTHLAKHGDGEL